MKKASRRKYLDGQRKFEGWMKRYWAGINLAWNVDSEDYVDVAAQVGWEVWHSFMKSPSQS